VIGLVSGALAVLFKMALGHAERSRWALLERCHSVPAWGWAVLPLIGLVLGSLAGWMTARWSAESAGSGIPHLKGVLLHVRTLDWRRVLPVKFVAGVMGIGSGLCLGREGPTVQMGAAAAQMLTKVLRTPKGDVNQLLSAGAGAGLAAAFNAPLAGLVFVIEELHREFSSRTAMGALVAAVIATVVAQYFTGDVSTFTVKGIHALPLGLLPLTVPLGVAAGVGGVLFNRALMRASAASFALPGRMKKWRWALPGLVCAGIGLVAWWVPEAAGAGHALAESLLTGELKAGLAVLAGLLVLKFLLTALSYGSGAPGGIFAPMLVLGTLVGGIFAAGLERLWPSTGIAAGSIAVLGMAGFFVASVRAPLTGIVLISEMTGGYELLLPICIVCLLAYLTAVALRDHPIYDALLEADLARNGADAATVGDSVRPLYMSVQSGSPMAGAPISGAGLPTGCLIVGVERAGRTLLPVDELVLLPGDHISVLIPAGRPREAMVVAARCCGM